MIEQKTKAETKPSAERTRPASPSVKVEPTRPPPRPRRPKPREHAASMRPGLKALSGFFTFLAVVLSGLILVTLWYDAALDQPGPLAETKPFVVKRGEGARDIAQRLADDGIVASAQLFTAYYVGRSTATWFGAKSLQLKAGEYDIQPQASLREVAEVIGEGKSVLARITIPEGLTSFQIVERIKVDRNLVGDVVALPPEGVLLPDTYKFARGMNRQAFLDMMAADGRKFLEQAWAERQPDLPLKTAEEALVLASIVEKETGRRDERTRVAAVFVNRLRKGMRLQSDPTILYGLFGGQVSWGRAIYRSEIQQRTAHNTYAIDGLPPTPICNPGRNSIIAVLAPAKTSELFFVADGKGGHIFTQNLKDHNAAVQNWRKVEQEIRAREATAQATRAVSRPAPAPVVTTVPSVGPGVRSDGAGQDEVPVEPDTAAPPAAAKSPTVAATGTPVQVPAESPAVPVVRPASAAPSDVPLPIRKPKR